MLPHLFIFMLLLQLLCSINASFISISFSTRRIKNVVASRLAVMETSPNIVEDMKEVGISLVVAHCEDNADWIPKYIG